MELHGIPEKMQINHRKLTFNERLGADLAEERPGVFIALPEGIHINSIRL
jgi:hypothetical protein